MESPDAKSIFLDALHLPPDEQQALIDACAADDPALRARVLELLDAHHDAGTFMSPGDDDVAFDDLAHQPKTIGGYQVLRHLGEGGFGTVYLCRQETPIQRDVAIKVLKPGMDSRMVLRRFEEERRLLSRMDHPGIARVLDAGRTETDQPYIVMEYIDGEEIRQFCDRIRATLMQRLELIADTCMAVEHAHQKGVIHRDLKPGNVLVTEVDGRPLVKVIDFGISKAVTPDCPAAEVTATLHLVGTPQYMSPEQASTSTSDIDTRTDVYSLGVLMYELVTGVPPLDPDRFKIAPYTQLEKMIREVDPPRPSTRIHKLSEEQSARIGSLRQQPVQQIIRELRGELDWIIRRAMEKERGRRYPTASALADDVRRALRGEIVEARPPSRLYAARKIIGRHRAAAVASGAVVLGLIAVATTSVLYAREIDQTNQRLEQTLHSQDRVLTFTESMLDGVNPETARGRDTTLFEEILERSAERLGEELHDAPDAEVRIRTRIGQIYLNLGHAGDAVTQFERAAETAGVAFGQLDSRTLHARTSLGAAYADDSQLERARTVLEDALDSTNTTFGPDHDITMAGRNNLAAVYRQLDLNDEAIELFGEVVDSRVRLLGTDDPATMAARNNLASVLHRAGELTRALELYETVAAFQLASLGDDHPRTLQTHNNLAEIYESLGRSDEAIAIHRQTLATKIRVLGDDHPSVIVSMVNLSAVLERHDSAAAARPLLEDAYQKSLRRLGPDHQHTLTVANNLAALLARSKDFEAAKEYAELASAGLGRLLGPKHQYALRSRSTLARILLELGQTTEAATLMQSICAVATESLDADSPLLASFHQQHGETLAADGQPEAARTAYQSALSVLDQIADDDTDRRRDILESISALESAANET